MATYRIIGHDQKQYGSVTEDQLRQWIAQGRANAQTRVQVEGATEWRELGGIPEFQAALAGALPPPLPPPAAPAVPAQTSGMAVTSLVLGILGVVTCGITALVGLVLGIIAMVRIRNSGGRLSGNGLALAGTIVSGIFVLMIPLFMALLLPAMAAGVQKAQEINCLNNEKQLALAVMVYSGDHTNHLPPAATWCDAIQSAAGGSDKVFKCPAANPGSRCDYAFNAKLDGLDAGKVNPQTVMIFEADGGWNANGGPELLPARARHGHGTIYVVAFADGHVEAVNQSRLNTLRWDP